MESNFKFQISNFKLLAAACVLTLFLSASCAEKQTLEKRLASPKHSTVKSALTDMWRTGDVQNIAAVVSLLDKKEFAEDAAFALNNLDSSAVDKIVLSGLRPYENMSGRLFYLYLASKKRPVKEIAWQLNRAKFKDDISWMLALMIEARTTGSPAALNEGFKTLEKLDTCDCPAAAREFFLLAGEKGGIDFYSNLEKFGKEHPDLKPVVIWAMHKIKPAMKIKIDASDRVIKSNPYWVKRGNAPVMPAIPGTFKSVHTANPDILTANGMIYFYYRGGDGNDRIALATAAESSFNGGNFTDYPRNPIVGIGNNSFDDLAALDPATVFFRDHVLLYYSGLGKKGIDAVGLATSKDYYTFAKYKKNPVLTGRAPEVVLKEGIIYMYYVMPNEYSGYSIYLATSNDGYNFTPFGSAPVFNYGPGREWDSKSVTVPRIREKNGVYYMFYAGDDKYRDYPAYFGLAFSYDLIHWYRSTQNPVFSRGKKGAWDDGGVWFPEVFPHNKKLYLYYEGWGGGESHEKEYGPGGHSQIGLAVSGYDLEDML